MIITIRPTSAIGLEETNTIGYYSWPLCVDLFRNGHLEFCLEAKTLSSRPNAQKPQEVTRFEPVSLIAHSFVAISLASRVFKSIGLTDPVIVSISFYNIKRYGLGSTYFSLEEHQIWPKDHLEIAPLQFFSLSPLRATTQECLNRIWQAFGHESAPDMPNMYSDI